MFTIAVEIPFELASGVGVFIVGCLYGAAKFWWELREFRSGSKSVKGPSKRDLEEERRKTELAKDAHVATLRAEVAELKEKADAVAAKDAHVATLQAEIADLKKSVSYRELLDAKDDKIEELSKALSKKSDEVAAKVQELLTLTLEKAEDAAERNGALVERTLEKVAQFTEEVRVLSATLASLSHRSRGGDDRDDRSRSR